MLMHISGKWSGRTENDLTVFTRYLHCPTYGLSVVKDSNRGKDMAHWRDSSRAGEQTDCKRAYPQGYGYCHRAFYLPAAPFRHSDTRLNGEESISASVPTEAIGFSDG